MNKIGKQNKYDADSIVPRISDSIVPIEEPSKYTLKRLNDGSINVGSKIGWIEWNEIGVATGKEIHDEPSIGRSLILNPHPVSYTWLTTVITEIVEQKEGYIKFTTKNSTYELTTK
jgi:hypothetical protein